MATLLRRASHCTNTVKCLFIYHYFPFFFARNSFNHLLRFSPHWFIISRGNDIDHQQQRQAAADSDQQWCNCTISTNKQNEGEYARGGKAPHSLPDPADNPIANNSSYMWNDATLAISFLIQKRVGWVFAINLMQSIKSLKHIYWNSFNLIWRNSVILNFQLINIISAIFS